MEVDITDSQQYSRRENIELANIPGDIQQKDLEKYVTNLLGSINVKIQSYDIAAVHRFGKVNRNNSRNIIVRFINRKNVISALRNRRYLKNSTNAQYKNTFIFENLCSTYRYLFNELRMMKYITMVVQWHSQFQILRTRCC